MGLAISHHTIHGWRSHWGRLCRWDERVEAILRARNPHSSLGGSDGDDVYVFFVLCFQLKDWIRNDPRIAKTIKKSIDQEVHSHLGMKVCRDLCNGIKLFAVTDPSVDAGFSTGREYVPECWPGDRPHPTGGSCSGWISYRSGAF